MPNQNNHERPFTLAYGVRLKRDPEQLSRDDLLDELYSLAEFASTKIIENRALQSIIARSFDRSHDE